MKLIAVLFIILTPVLATDEYVDSILKLFEHADDPDFLIKLQKRLENDLKEPVINKKSFPIPEKHFDAASEEKHILENKSPQCKSHMFLKTIIRTEDSLKAGAKYLDSGDSLHSNEACVDRCCKLEGCDLAVFENKTKHVCYMFKCRNDKTGKSSCKFDSHADYLANTVSGNEGVETPPHIPKVPKPKSDLGGNLEKVTVVTEEMKPAHNSELEPTTRPTQLPHSAALGDRCQFRVSCEDLHAECSDRCQCQQGYQNRKGVCRQVCGQDEIECKIRGTSSVGPDCIPRSQQCDGTTQCADGSDEKNCPETTVADKHLQAWQPQRQPESPDTTYDSDGYGYNLLSSDSPSSQHLQSQLEKSSPDADKDADYKEEPSPKGDNSMKLTDMVNNAYNSEEKYDGDIRENSLDVDKELEAATSSETVRPRLKPTLHPTKPSVSWYGVEGEGDTRGEDSEEGLEEQQAFQPEGSRRVHRVDTTVDDSGEEILDGVTAANARPGEGVLRGRPEAVPRHRPQVEVGRTHAPSQTSPSNPRDGSMIGPFRGSQGNPRLNTNPHPSKNEYQQGFNPLYPSQGRRPFRPKPNSDMASTDYDGDFYGSRPLQQRPFRPSRPKGQFHKTQHTNFNHPYLGGYNYDYNDYDPYNSFQGQDYNRPYGNHDSSSYPLNSFGGGYNNGDQRNNFNPSEGNRNQQSSSSQESSSSEQSQTPNLVDNSQPVQLDKDTDSSQSSNEQTTTSVDTVDVVTTKSSTNDNADDKQQMSTDKEDNTNLPASKEETKIQETHQSSTPITDTKIHKVPENTVESKPPPKDEKHPDVVEEGDNSVFMSKQRVVVASFTDKAEGPIIALSLGLAFTLMLLIFVGCRLRNVRRRLRKGRPLHQNEADYLINGMYL